MRGYLTRSGVGLIAGLWLLGLGFGLAQRVTRTESAPATAWIQRIGPFAARVERVVVDRPAGRAYVQLHLERPGGPVPVEQRIPVCGEACLEGGWSPAGATWLIRNEFGRFPRGEVWEHPRLGPVPATRHAGEARAIFAFNARPGARLPERLHFLLPDGDWGTLSLPEVTGQ